MLLNIVYIVYIVNNKCNGMLFFKLIIFLEKIIFLERKIVKLFFE